nr:CoA transferase [Amycolatopsis pithecellobii]
MVASLLADYGADVLKVERTRDDSLRSLGWSKDGVPLWCALAARNKNVWRLTCRNPKGRKFSASWWGMLTF